MIYIVKKPFDHHATGEEIEMSANEARYRHLSGHVIKLGKKKTGGKKTAVKE